MADFPPTPVVYGKHGSLCTADIMHSKVATYVWASNTIWTTSTAWGTANLALYLPVILGTPATVYKMGVTNGTVINGNFDLGIYDERGVKLVSTGSTAQSGASALQTVDVTDTILLPGTYYLALASNSTTATFTCATTVLLRQEATLVQEQLTAFALPSPATLGTKSTRLFAPIVTAYYNANV
jgi:hypothetical protein